MRLPGTGVSIIRDQLPKFCSTAAECATARSFGCRQMLCVSSDELNRISNVAPSGSVGFVQTSERAESGNLMVSRFRN